MTYILIPTNKIIKKLGFEPNGDVQTFFTNTCYRYMDKYTPFDEGNLSSIVTIEPASITYEVPYASYQYFGERNDGSHKIDERNRNRDFHSLATSYWDREMVSAEGKDVTKEVADYVRRVL